MKIKKIVLSIIMVGVFLFSLNVSAVKTTQNTSQQNLFSTSPSQYTQQSSSVEDIDPLVDLEVTVTIKEIRALKKMDNFGQADFFVVYPSPAFPFRA